MINISNDEIDQVLDAYEKKRHDLRIFMDGVLTYIGKHPDLRSDGKQIIHSYKSRLKDKEHLREKIKRRANDGKKTTAENLFNEITDLAGVRILHLYQHQFKEIDDVIREKVNEGDWILGERPKAYTWDPETVQFFSQFDLDVSQKQTFYTSVHYLIKPPRENSPICCELQVRTLFEEIWGEVDHQINYPVPTSSIATKEQIMVLSKIVGAGSRLLESLQRVHQAGS